MTNTSWLVRTSAFPFGVGPILGTVHARDETSAHAIAAREHPGVALTVEPRGRTDPAPLERALRRLQQRQQRAADWRRR